MQKTLGYSAWTAFQGFFVVLTLLFLAPKFSNLPEAVLGAIVIEAVAFGLLKFAEMKKLWKLEGKEFQSIDNFPDSITFPGIVILRFDGPLYFATANSLRNRISEVTTNVELPIKAVIFDVESTGYVDLLGAEELEKVIQEMRDRGIEFYLARTKTGILNTFNQVGVMEGIGDARIFERISRAVDAAQQLPDIQPDIENTEKRRLKIWDIYNH